MSCSFCVVKSKWAHELFSYIPWNMCVKVSFLHDNQVPQPQYQCVCVLISVRLRKDRTNEVSLCFRGGSSLWTHPYIYHHRYSPSRIHWQVHVKSVVLWSSMHCVTMTKISQKLLRHTYLKDPQSGVHLVNNFTSLLVLKMSCSTVVDAHKALSSWFWRHNPSPPSPFWF